MTHRIALDTDPGIDDALALLLAARASAARLDAVSVTYGNTTLDRAVRNPPHLYKEFLVVPAKHQRIGHGTHSIPAKARIVGIRQNRKLLTETRNLLRKENPVLEAAGIWFPLYMDKSPAPIGVTECGTVPAHRLHRDIFRDVLYLFQFAIIKPRGAGGSPIHPKLQHDPVDRLSRHK